MDRKPHFRFFPGAYEDEAAFESSTETCEVCGEACAWRYIGGIYAEEHPDIVCAACIHSGRLSEHLDGDMALHDIELDGADEALEREVLERTPGVSCFNPFAWPVRDGKPLAFIGYGEDKALITLPDVQAAVEEAAEEYGLDDAAALPSPYVLIFKEIDGPRYAAALDFD